MNLDIMPREGFKKAFDNRSPQQKVTDATKERGYRDGWTPEQFLARQIVKMMEELGELTHWILDFPNDELAERICDLATLCRHDFDDTERWKESKVKADAAIINNPKLLQKEAADMQVVLFNMADAIATITGQPFDVVQAAVEKSKGDVERGTR